MISFARPFLAAGVPMVIVSLWPVDSDVTAELMMSFHRHRRQEKLSSAADLVRKTPDFWKNYVLPKITNEFWGLHRFLNQPYPSGPNDYLQRVEANIAKVQKQLTTARA